MSKMITILRNFPWITAAAGTYVTPWVYYPAELGDCEMITVVECMDSGSVDVHLESSTDGVSKLTTGSASGVNTVGPHQDTFAVKGSMVRVELESAAQTFMTLSVYLLPKVS